MNAMRCNANNRLTRTTLGSIREDRTYNAFNQLTRVLRSIQ